MQPIEDFGVEPDVYYELNSTDIPNSRSLLAFAVNTLSQIPIYSLSIESFEIIGDQLKIIALTSPNIERLMYLLNGVPEYVKTDLEPADGIRRIDLSVPFPKTGGTPELRGFAIPELLRNGKKNQIGYLELVAKTIPRKARTALPPI